MSLSFGFDNNIFSLNKVSLPSRYYYFKEKQNYVKLVSVGEGLFPKDKINNTIKLTNSSLVLASESATKVYKSSEHFAINRFDFELQNSNLEFLNDELILFKNSKLLQFFSLNFDENSTFFYTDLLSSGRSFENYDFSSLHVKNKFLHNGILEYLEEYEIGGNEVKKYLEDFSLDKRLFAKVYVKIKNSESFTCKLLHVNVNSYEYTQNKAFLIVLVSGETIGDLKSKIKEIWKIYREESGLKEFDLGKF
ncbi:MAG: urease accessory protein UreD [Campylobacteraceae bacterium]